MLVPAERTVQAVFVDWLTWGEWLSSAGAGALAIICYPFPAVKVALWASWTEPWAVSRSPCLLAVDTSALWVFCCCLLLLLISKEKNYLKWLYRCSSLNTVAESSFFNWRTVYNVVSVSDAQHSDSVVHIHMFLFIFFSTIGCYTM